jgi:hypothetical protein
MKRRSLITRLTAAVTLSAASWARSEVYLTPEQAKDVLLGGQAARSFIIMLTPQQKSAIAEASGVRVRTEVVKGWRAANGSWLVLDNVIGKHEFIDFALAINADGSVKGLEILTYRETYGGQVRAAPWRAQFTGKTAAAPVKIDADIKNISGATLSSVHITDGVRRLLHTHALVLKNS